MSIQIGQQQDFNRLQALNLVFHSSINSSPPSTPVEGQPWYVTDSDVLRIYTGSVWNTLVVGPASSTSGRVPTWNGTSGGALADGYDIVTTVGGTGADTALPTEQAVREAISSALASEVSFKGGYDASANTPDLDVSPTGVKAGDMYYVSTAGTFFTTPLEAGDVIIANIDSADAEAEWTMVEKNLPNIIPVANGGTGIATTTAYSVICAGTTATGAFQSLAALGSAGTFLRSAGAGALPAFSTLVLPNAGTIGDLPHVSSSNTVTMLTSVATAGSFLRGGGSSTVPAWSTVKLPDTMSAFGIWVANTANTVVNLTVTALQSIRLNSGGTAWEVYTPTGGGNHNILDGSNHSDSVAGTVARGTMIVGNSTPKWSLLAFQASGASGYVLATDSTDTGWKKQRYVEKLSTSATSYDIVHNLGTRRVIVTCQDTTNNQNILIDWQCKSGSENTTITVSFGTAPTSNTRIITVFGINFGNALDTAN